MADRSCISRRFAFVLMLSLTAGPSACAPRRLAPTASQPVPGYVPVEATTAQAWDAVVDFLVDNGIEFEFISSEMRVAKITAILADGPIAVKGGFMANPVARTFADCGTIRGEQLAGWADLVADIAVRVRPGGNGALLKVVIPRMRHEPVGAPGWDCVSTGEFEARAEARITERLQPIMKARTGGS